MLISDALAQNTTDAKVVASAAVLLIFVQSKVASVDYSFDFQTVCAS
tara:strand:- start:491 stop:631 length:141 start_codon:yes stop_codon:yes gene_type:complete